MNILLIKSIFTYKIQYITHKISIKFNKIHRNINKIQ